MNELLKKNPENKWFILQPTPNISSSTYFISTLSFFYPHQQALRGNERQQCRFINLFL